MAYRFTDSDKWADPWFRNLTPNGKTLFLFICDNCDMAGFWEIDLDMACFKTKISQASIDKALMEIEKAYVRQDRWLWLRNFLRHQKNIPLNPDNRAHRAAINAIEDKKELFPNVYDLFQRGFEGALKGLASPTGIGIGKGIGNSKSKEGGAGGRKESRFNEAWKAYPAKLGDKARAEKAYTAAIKAGTDHQHILDQIEAYKTYVDAQRKNGHKDLAYAHGATWFHQCRWDNDYTITNNEPDWEAINRKAGLLP